MYALVAALVIAVPVLWVSLLVIGLACSSGLRRTVRQMHAEACVAFDQLDARRPSRRRTFLSTASS